MTRTLEGQRRKAFVGIASIALTDTTFVAVSRDNSTIAFGEGAVDPGRVFLFTTDSGEDRSVTLVFPGEADIAALQRRFPGTVVHIEVRPGERLYGVVDRSSQGGARGVGDADCRGAGLSDRDVSDFSLDASIEADLERVAGCDRRVRILLATDTAFSSATRTTLVGSMIPASNRST